MRDFWAAQYFEASNHAVRADPRKKVIYRPDNRTDVLLLKAGVPVEAMAAPVAYWLRKAVILSKPFIA